MPYSNWRGADDANGKCNQGNALGDGVLGGSIKQLIQAQEPRIKLL
jgi:hypothetical protein